MLRRTFLKALVAIGVLPTLPTKAGTLLSCCETNPENANYCGKCGKSLRVPSEQSIALNSTVAQIRSATAWLDFTLAPGEKCDTLISVTGAGVYGSVSILPPSMDHNPILFYGCVVSPGVVQLQAMNPSRQSHRVDGPCRILVMG